METESDDSGSAPREKIASVVENRITGTTVHGLIGASVVLLPQLANIPTAVISGLFLYLGRKMCSGNEFLYRTRLILTDPALYPPESYLKKVTATTANMFTLLQASCLAGLLLLKNHPATALCFPSMIAVLVCIRYYLAPLMFSNEALAALDENIEDDFESSGEIMEDAAGLSPLKLEE